MNKAFIKLFVAIFLILTLTTNALAETEWKNGAYIGGGVGAGIGVGAAVATCIDSGASCAALVPFSGMALGLFGVSIGALIGEAFKNEERETNYARRFFWAGEIIGLSLGLISAVSILTAPNIGSGDADAVPEIAAAILSTTLLPGVFGLIGWGIGSRIQKDTTVSLYPTLLVQENTAIPGMGLKFEF